MVDDTGAVESASGYRPFGTVLEGGGEPYGFTGEMAETGLGLVFLRARWYQPRTGRFLSKDPSRLEENLYLYARSNPVNKTDPSGYCTFNIETGEWECFGDETGMGQTLATDIHYGPDIRVFVPDYNHTFSPRACKPGPCLTGEGGIPGLAGVDTSSEGWKRYASLCYDYWRAHPERFAQTLVERVQPTSLTAAHWHAVNVEERDLFNIDEVNRALEGIGFETPAMMQLFIQVVLSAGSAAETVRFAQEIRCTQTSFNTLGLSEGTSTTGLNKSSPVYLEYKALRLQGYTAEEAYSLMKQFRAGVNPNDEFAFHFTSTRGGIGITKDGFVKASSFGLRGPGVYAGTTPTPSSFLKHAAVVGWGLGPTPVRIPIRIRPNLPYFYMRIPPQTIFFPVSNGIDLTP